MKNIIFVTKESRWSSETTLKTRRNRKALRVGMYKYISMKRVKMFIASLAIIATMASCSLTMPVNATSNTVGSKVGTAKATGFLGVLFFNQDASIKTAAKNAGITKISTVDVKCSNVLGLVVTYETIVTGE